MFYNTFSATLGMALAIGVIALVVMITLKKYIWKTDRSNGGNKEERKSFLGRLRPKSINALSGRLLLSVSILFSFGFIPSCMSVSKRSHPGNIGLQWIWILLPKELMVPLFCMVIFLGFLVIMTNDMDKDDYKILDD